ncbi:response regulator [Ramlibacter sp. G-1-2-2]|uniref:Response regulator n=1 Tax=Ramlibacter agri TaxID=2728837 RepID=A0A848H387_9BURK|nr:response regulator [Ramlibacter agri]NML45034.1 response regulator [Ramlibacter agri]
MNSILIVEDNDRNMKLFRDLLQFAGYRTIEASTGAQGLAAARQHQPDLVLMDIQLPDTDGVAVLRSIREEAGLRMPVLAVSASVMPDDQQRVVVSGFDGFITKPIHVKSFLATVKQALEARA